MLEKWWNAIYHWIPAGSIKNISLRKCEKAHNGMAGENVSLKDGLQRDCNGGFALVLPNRNVDTICNSLTFNRSVGWCRQNNALD